MKNHHSTLSGFGLNPRFAAVSLVAILSCHAEPKAVAAQEESAFEMATRVQITQTDLAPDGWAGYWSGAAEPDANDSTDGLSPAEQWDAARYETSEAFRYTGHALDADLETQG